jgi:hypothetical protein
MRNNLIVAISYIRFVCARKEFSKNKDSIESLSTVIITTDAIIGSKFNAKNKAGSTYFISPKLKPSTMMMFLDSKNSTRTNYSRRWFWLTTKHWNARN